MARSSHETLTIDSKRDIHSVKNKMIIQGSYSIFWNQSSYTMFYSYDMFDEFEYILWISLVILSKIAVIGYALTQF